jgi:hypothetical protein
MERLRLGKSVRSVVQLQRDSSGQLTPVLLHGKAQSGKKKKGSPGLRLLDRAARRLLRAQQAFTDSYLSRHTRSNSKRRDGWLTDLGQNVSRARAKGVRKLKLRKLLPV